MASNLADFKQDRVYATFVGDDFNLQTTITAIGNLPFNDQLAKISSGIETIKHRISQLTSAHCEEFFQRTARLDDLYQELQFIRIKSQNLSRTLELINAKLDAPYQQLRRQIALIARLQKTCDLLRKMLRIMHLSKRMHECDIVAEFRADHEQSIYLKEIIKMSQYVNEMDTITASDDERLLPKLSVIEHDLLRVRQTKSMLVDEADRMLAEGLRGSDSNLIGAALLVSHNLGSLDERLIGLINEKCALIGQTISKSLNIRELKTAAKLNITGSSAGGGGGGGQSRMALRNTLQASIKSMLDTIAAHFKQVCTVIRLLRKRRDNFSQAPLIEFVTNDEATLGGFWNRATQIMTSLVTKHANESATLKQMLETDYPQVLLHFVDFWKTINNLEPEVGSERALRCVIINFESAFLSNSLSTLFEAVNRIFADAKQSGNRASIGTGVSASPSPLSSASSGAKIFSVPSERDVDCVIRCIDAELSAASVDAQLSAAAVKNVLKTVNLFLVKCEHLASVDGDSTQVIGPFTASQRHNALIVRILHFFAQQIDRSLSNFAQQQQQQTMKSVVDPIIGGAINSINTLVLTIFEPLIASVQDAIEAIILTMHSEDYNIASPANDDNAVQCSLYMKELQRFISRISHDYLSQFDRECATIEKRIWQMAATTIDSFLLHKCLLSPVSSGGRRKIAADMTQLESAIAPISERMGDFGRSYQMLRAFRTLLPLPPEQIARSSAIGNPIPFGLALHFMISNYAPPELRPPHKYMDWSITRYVKWLCNSTEEQRLTLINDTLDSYVKQVRKSQRKTFAPVYPLLVEMMKNALSAATDSERKLNERDDDVRE